MSTKTVLQNTLPGTAEWRMMLPDALLGKLGASLRPEFEYTAEDLDCQYCLHISKNGKLCTAKSCVCLPERLHAGCVSDDELYGRPLAAKELGAFAPPTGKRPYNRKTIKTLFVSNGHHERWRGLIKEKALSKKSPPAFAAALFLLTSSHFLWIRIKPHLERGTIRFPNVDIRGIDTNGYAIYKAAKELYAGNQHILLSELADPDIVSDTLLRLIINSLIVRRHGIQAVKS